MADIDQPETESSIADRAAEAFLGREPATDDSPETEPTNEASADEAPAPESVPDTVEIEYDGERYSIPKSLEKAILQERDYTQKSQEVAEQRRKLEARQAQQDIYAREREFEQSIREESMQLSAMDAWLEQQKKTDWASLATDDLLRKRIEIDGVKERRDELAKTVESKRSEFEESVKKSTAELRQKSLEALSKSVPNWSEATLKAVRERAESEGFTGDEIDRIMLDARSAKVLWKAAEYDRLKAATGKASQAASAAPPIVKPGAVKQMQPAVKNDLALRKQQSTAKTSSEKARIIAQRLEARF